jgi:TonB family protein
MLRFGSMICAAVIFACHASAQLTVETVDTYNAALITKDAAVIKPAALSLASAAVNDADNPEAGLFAYEAAWTLCRIDACKEALPFAQAAEALPGAPPHAGLLAIYAAWKAAPEKASAKVLDAALEAAATSKPSGLSVAAYRARYNDQLAKRDYRGSERVARAAALHLRDAGAAFLPIRFEARLVEISSRFNYYPRIESAREMLALVGELDMVCHTDPAAEEKWAEARYWQAYAWMLTMNAFFASEDKPVLSEAEQSAVLDAEPPAATQKVAPVADEPEEPDICPGEFIQRPQIRYPSSAAAAGKFGSVILRVMVTDGKVSDVDVLASVPFDGFRDEVVQTVTKWRWAQTPGPAPSGCRPNNGGLIVPVIFEIG